jgi:tetratricopeptide (TPR) repeat protein
MAKDYGGTETLCKGLLAVALKQYRMAARLFRTSTAHTLTWTLYLFIRGGMEQPSRPCAACALENARLRCPCKVASYCGKVCQKASWLEHKDACTVNLSRELVVKCREFGNDAPEVGYATMKLGSMFFKNGRLNSAQRSFLEVVRIYGIYGEQVWAEQMLAAALGSLGTLYHIQGKYEEAGVILRDALTILRRISNENHESVEEAVLFNQLGHTMQMQGKHAEAAEHYEKALTIFRDIFGSEHECVAEVLATLGCVFRWNNMPEKAMENYTEALRIQRSRLSGDHPILVSTLVRIAAFYMEENMLDEALSNLHEALPALRCYFGEKSLQVARALWMLARIYREQGNIKRSLKVHRKVLRYRQKALGDDHEDVAVSMTDIALILIEDFAECDEALDLLNQATRIQSRALARGADDWHESMLLTSGAMASCLEEMAEHREVDLRRASGS